MGTVHRREEFLLYATIEIAAWKELKREVEFCEQVKKITVNRADLPL